jgi:hypothetical protein
MTPISRLHYLCDTIPALLSTIPEEEFIYKPAPHKWSKKEILGHLIDSASNNHQRFVRVQFENIPSISYDPDLWNNHGYYNQLDSKSLISFWENYNRHLAILAEHIPTGLLKRECNTGGAVPVTLEWLIQDYVVHLEHHLKEIISYT